MSQPTLCQVRPSQQAKEGAHRQISSDMQDLFQQKWILDWALLRASTSDWWKLHYCELWKLLMQPRWMAFTTCFFPNPFAGAKILFVHLQCCLPLCWNCFILSSCSQSPALPFALSVPFSPPDFAVSLLWHPQHDHTQHYPVCFFFLTATHRKFSSEGGFVKRPLSLCVVSGLFPFCSSCHSSLLLSLSSVMNLICFPLLLDWRYLHSCYSVYSKGDSSILLLSLKSNSFVQNVFFLGGWSRWSPEVSSSSKNSVIQCFFSFKSLLPLQFEVGSSFLSPALDPRVWKDPISLSLRHQSHLL